MRVKTGALVSPRLLANNSMAAGPQGRAAFNSSRPGTMKKLLLVAFTSIALAASAQGVFAQQDQDDDMGAPPPPAARDELRFDQLSDQMREMTGRIEDLQHTVDVLRQRLDKMQTDYDARLQALEQANGGGAGRNPPPTAMNNQAPVLTPPPPRNRNAGTPPLSNQTATAGQPPADAGTLPNGSPQHQYDYAFGLLRDANYPAAERALRDFVHRYPDNRLASNAQYWLGETYYVRRNFQAAAAAFAEGYQRYPKGPKAADDLLKLGSSLSMLGRRADACRSFAQLDREFPIAPANRKAQEAEEKRKAACH
jgi:tol-pal system protein YbgF